MTDQSVASVCGLIAETRKSGDMVSITISGEGEGNRLSISNAPSYVLDAITGNGYYLRAEYGSVVVTAEEG